MTYQNSYELELDVGFALLEQLEGPQGAARYRSGPDQDAFTSLMLTGVYGGNIDPDGAQEFWIYNIVLPEDIEELDDDLKAVLSEELDSLFGGWVYDERRGKVYILADGDSATLS
ncbi:hypothetical protein DL240_18085 [Lujinxingia litoralis]|uniref:Uncharacterized protein n=1 Tax=Lujinxingia litoralis TaxID=2211119 RepID=A0A328C1X7_9DELT|nr:hypothetical protein [Lujinxingia litoralis]RAL20289.1 hypothetical protein DL240_18085 [Lujinxingia litoralis]